MSRSAICFAFHKRRCGNCMECACDKARRPAIQRRQPWLRSHGSYGLIMTQKNQNSIPNGPAIGILRCSKFAISRLPNNHRPAIAAGARRNELKPLNEMSKQQKRLYDVMSDISEECHCAGWMAGNEYAIWNAMGRSESVHYGMREIDRRKLTECAALSLATDSWIVWLDDQDGLDPHDS